MGKRSACADTSTAMLRSGKAAPDDCIVTSDNDDDDSLSILISSAELDANSVVSVTTLFLCKIEKVVCRKSQLCRGSAKATLFLHEEKAIAG
jgi:hypothetical protein